VPETSLFIISLNKNNMKNTVLITLIAIIIQFNSFSQTRFISGIILQLDSTTVISSASVYLKNTPYKTISNGNGQFKLDNIPTGQYELVVFNIGYKTIHKSVNIKNGNQKNMTIYLTENVAELPSVVVTTGGKSNINKISGSTHYISEKEIQKYGYTDINKTLKSVPGVNMQEEDGFGLRPNIGLRGTGVERSSKITVMEDGILMAPAPYIAPSAYYFPTIGRMQGVEILKGSSQIKYGPYTTGGAINLISTQIPNQFGGRINLTSGSFGSKTLHAFVGNSHQNFGYLIETFQYGADGFKTLQNGGNTGFDKKDYLAKLRFNTDKNAKIYQSITFKVGQSTENSNETYLGLTQTDFDANPYLRYAGSQMDNMNTKQRQFSATHIIKFSHQFNITTSAYYSDFTRNWYKLDNVQDSSGTKLKIGNILDNPADNLTYYNVLNGNPNQINNTLFVKANNRSYYAKGLQTVASYKFNTNKIIHKIDVGIRVHQDQIDRYQWVDEYNMVNNFMQLTNKGAAGTESNRIETANALAAYAQYKFKFGKFTATPGLRYENIQMYRLDYGKQDVNRTGINLSTRNNFVQVFIPGIGLNYKFTKFLNVFSGIHKGFAPPGTKEGTKPEESINYEIGTRYAKRSLNFELVLFLNDYNNLLGADLEAAGGQGTTALFNGGEVSTNGVEFQMSYDVLSFKKTSKFNLPITAVYTYTDATFKNTFDSDFAGWGDITSGDKYPYLSNHQLTIQASLEHQKFGLNLSGSYQSAMRTTPGVGTIPQDEKIDAYFTLNSSLNYNLHQNIELFGSVTNITNQVYVVAKRPAGLIPGMPRAFNLGLKARF